MYMYNMNKTDTTSEHLRKIDESVLECTQDYVDKSLLLEVN